MNIHRHTHGFPQVWDGMSTASSGSGRSSGTHLSGIIRQLAVKHNIFPAETQKYDSARLLRFNVGFAWEHWCVRHLPGAIHQPGECYLDGIYMSPDAITLDDNGYLTLHEFKATWKSAATPIQDGMVYWLWQVMGYLAGLSAKYHEQYTVAVIHPLYLNGDYRDHRHPMYGPDPDHPGPVRLEFEWREIEANWELMVASKGMAEKEDWTQ